MNLTSLIHKSTFLLGLTAIVAADASADVKLPSVLSDGVVLQRDLPVKIWGTASPGERVDVSLASRKATATADAAGRWHVTLDPVKAGGPYTLKANDAVVEDVLMGDIYICSGQSNMELPIGRVLDMFADEVAAYENSNIREFKTPKEYAFHGVRDDVSPAEWKSVTPDKVNSWGALTYFIAKKLYEENGGVPVGVVNSSWGGSKIEAWISEEGITPWPERLHKLRVNGNDGYREMLSKAERKARWLWDSTLRATDAGYASPLKWSSRELDDSSWDSVELLDTSWGKKDGRAVNGSHWLRRTFDVPASKAGRPAVLRLGCIVDADSAWINGRYVGNITYQYPPRIYTVPAGLLHEGKNSVVVRVASYSGVPHVVPEKPHKLLFADGEEISLEGKWRHRIGSRMNQAPTVTDFFQNPTVLYNGMIAPMAGLPFRGVVWYQGESDVDINDEYAALMKALVKDWRKTFDNPQLPFYIVELADFLHPSDVAGRAEWQKLRDAQRRAADETEGVTWILNSDNGEWNDIHPLDKKTPGTRVAEAILKDAK